METAEAVMCRNPAISEKEYPLQTVQHHDEPVFFRQLHHGAVKRAVLRLRRQIMLVRRLRREPLCRRKLILAVVDRQLCQKRAFPPGPDGQILLQQLAEYRLHRVLRIMRRPQIPECHPVNPVRIRIIKRQHLFLFHTVSPFP